MIIIFEIGEHFYRNLNVPFYIAGEHVIDTCGAKLVSNAHVEKYFETQFALILKKSNVCR